MAYILLHCWNSLYFMCICWKGEKVIIPVVFTTCWPCRQQGDIRALLYFLHLVCFIHYCWTFLYTMFNLGGDCLYKYIDISQMSSKQNIWHEIFCSVLVKKKKLGKNPPNFSVCLESMEERFMTRLNMFYQPKKFSWDSSVLKSWKGTFHTNMKATVTHRLSFLLPFVSCWFCFGWQKGPGPELFLG